jgi:hypothetical protein
MGIIKHFQDDNDDRPIGMGFSNWREDEENGRNAKKIIHVYNAPPKKDITLKEILEFRLEIINKAKQINYKIMVDMATHIKLDDCVSKLNEMSNELNMAIRTFNNLNKEQ